MEELPQTYIVKSKALERVLAQSIHTYQYLPHDYLLELASEVLHIPKDMRDEKQRKILKLALRDVQFFKKMITDQGDNLFEQCLDRIEHFKFEKDQIVCSIGEVGNAFYVVISGEVSVNVQVQKGDEKAKSKGKNKTHLELQEVSVLKAGSYFGELALLNDAPRTATIICKETCNFAVLFRDDFREVFAKHAMWQIQQDIQFFSSLPLFATSSKRAISTLIYHFKLLKFVRNNVIFKEGDEATHLYIIKRGEVKITKKVDITVPENPYSANDENASKKIGQRILELVVLGQKEIFGEQELVYGMKRETSATVASTDAEIWAIDKADFERRLIETEEFTDYFNTYCKGRLDQRNKRLQFIKDTVAQSQELVHNGKSRPGSPELKRPDTSSPTKRPASSSPTKRPVTSSPTTQLPQRRTLSPRKEETIDSPVSFEKMNKNTIEVGKLLQLQLVAKDTEFQKENNRSPSPLMNSPVIMSTTHQSFYRNIQSAKKKSIDLARRTLSISTRPQTRHEATIPHADRTVNSWNPKAPRPVTGTRILFEQNIFEENKPKIRPKSNNNSKPQLARRKSSDSASRKQTDIMNRTHITTKKRGYANDMELQNSLVEHQEKILREKLDGLAVDGSVTLDFLDEFPKKRKPKGPPNHHLNLTLVDRIKNLPVFQTETLTKTDQEPEVKNIHVHSKRMQAFVKDVFKNQVKILRHIGFAVPQRPTSGYRSNPEQNHRYRSLQNSLQNSILLNDQMSRNLDSNRKSPRSGRSMISSLRNSIELDANNQFIMRPRYSRENSFVGSPKPHGIAIRGLQGRALHDSL